MFLRLQEDLIARRHNIGSKVVNGASWEGIISEVKDIVSIQLIGTRARCRILLITLKWEGDHSLLFCGVKSGHRGCVRVSICKHMVYAKQAGHDIENSGGKGSIEMFWREILLQDCEEELTKLCEGEVTKLNGRENVFHERISLLRHLFVRI